MHKIIAIIPARSGSKGVPDKNVRNLGGFPLIQWSIEACKKSKMISPPFFGNMMTLIYKKRY